MATASLRLAVDYKKGCHNPGRVVDAGHHPVIKSDPVCDNSTRF